MFSDSSLWGLFFSSLISSTLFPGGSEALLLWLASEQQHNHFNLWLIATIGNSLGGMISWGMGWGMATWMRKRAGKVAASTGAKKEQAKDKKPPLEAMRRIRKYGTPVLLFSWLPLIGDPLCVAAGYLRCNVVVSAIYISCGKALRYAFLLALPLFGN